MIIIPIAIIWAYAVFDLIWRRHDMRWWLRRSQAGGGLDISVIGAWYAAIATSRGSVTRATGELSYSDLDHCMLRPDDRRGLRQARRSAGRFMRTGEPWLNPRTARRSRCRPASGRTRRTPRTQRQTQG
jgi:hypothetical protein